MTTNSIYKLIPFPNTDGEWMVVDTNSDNIAPLYWSEFGIISNKKDAKHTSWNGVCRIVACTKPIDPSIPLIRKEQIVFAPLFKDLPADTCKEIATLAYGHKEWITSDLVVRYKTFDPKEFEDADEYFEIVFEGYFMGNTTASYKVRIYPDSNVYIWYSYKEESNKVLYSSNQNKIQEILSSYFNKHAETYKYTEEDLRKAMELFAQAANKHLHKTDPNFGVFKKIDEIIQSLNKPKERIVTFEMEEEPIVGDGIDFTPVLKKFPKVDKDGYINIIKIDSSVDNSMHT